MEYNKIENLLGISADSDIKLKYSIKKQIEIFDQSNGTYNKNKDIRFNTSQMRNDFCDFNEACIAVTGKITATSANLPNNINPPNNIVYSRKVALENTPAPFFNCVLKINSQLIEDAQDLDLVIRMYNLLYYSKSFRKTTGSFWNYYPDMSNSRYIGENDEKTRVFYPINNSESFNYKTKLIGNLPAGNNVELEDIKIVVPLKN